MSKAVVVGEHTLGVIIGNEIQVLRASVLRGAPSEGNPFVGCIPMQEHRLATRADFDAFSVHYHPDYEVI